MRKEQKYLISLILIVITISCTKERVLSHQELVGYYVGVTVFKENERPGIKELKYFKYDHNTNFGEDGLMITDYYTLGVKDTTDWYLNLEVNELVLLKKGFWDGNKVFEISSFSQDSIVYQGRIRTKIDGVPHLLNQKTVLFKQ